MSRGPQRLDTGRRSESTSFIGRKSDIALNRGSVHQYPPRKLQTNMGISEAVGKHQSQVNGASIVLGLKSVKFLDRMDDQHSKTMYL